MREKAHVNVVLDRSGSMEAIRNDTIGGFNTFLAEQKRVDGDATLTLVQFDTQDPYEVVHRMAPIDLVPELTHETYVPRGGTPLLDALGRGIADLEARIAAMPADEKPKRVVFAVITDGAENASREFRRPQIVEAIERKTKEDDWQFVFLSADLGAIGEAIRLGVAPAATLRYGCAPDQMSAAWTALSTEVLQYRTGTKPRIGFDPRDRRRSGDSRSGSEVRERERQASERRERERREAERQERQEEREPREAESSGRAV